ncbi:MAG: hypothetical protein MZV64_37005 [Ignavibacteriales bacterium]|nr:hypothetical protein [Ignavibacteriales bacterium]
MDRQHGEIGTSTASAMNARNTDTPRSMARRTGKLKTDHRRYPFCGRLVDADPCMLSPPTATVVNITGRTGHAEAARHLRAPGILWSYCLPTRNGRERHGKTLQDKIDKGRRAVCPGRPVHNGSVRLASGQGHPSPGPGVCGAIPGQSPHRIHNHQRGERDCGGGRGIGCGRYRGRRHSPAAL